ncbi:MAG: carboxypeptidase-like regulatory domain-containing protein [Bacteroidetes bacterium]|nr:carboxypeptidase-like regulatory domain-containing protein [Bacteroidota bacterium]
MKRNLLKGFNSTRGIYLLLCLISVHALTASNALAAVPHAATRAHSAALIKGTVTDSKGLPLPGATVKIKGTQTATVTDANGQFSIDASPGAVLVVSFAGYLTKEAAISGNGSLTIQLSEDTKPLN